MFLKRSLLLMAWTQEVTLTKSPRRLFVADPVIAREVESMSALLVLVACYKQEYFPS